MVAGELSGRMWPLEATRWYLDPSPIWCLCHSALGRIWLVLATTLGNLFVGRHARVPLQCGVITPNSP